MIDFQGMNMIRWEAHMCLPLHPQASFAPIDQLRDAGLNYVSINVGLDIGFSEAGLNDQPPGDFDRSYWWPESVGYASGVSGMRYTPVDTWQKLDAALQSAGMRSDEVALVLGGNMVRVAQQVWPQPKPEN